MEKSGKASVPYYVMESTGKCKTINCFEKIRISAWGN